MSDGQGFEPGFSVTGGKGFHVRYPNGWTISVQFGWGNYCENKVREDKSPHKRLERVERASRSEDRESLGDALREHSNETSADAEIAIWANAADELAGLAELGGRMSAWVNFGGDEVQGYVQPLVLTQIMSILAASEDAFLDFARVQEEIREVLDSEEDEE
ncbi:hypothetical protein CMI37_16395 [Candidatus Pacearchaeota archaeon]|nr:hypothetical protein [Candidatus Pacearchaeota archaeon]|tara:strand:- start:742 stop:1224 length:483 start_codon:yes stop_codon:yes gene_type:complete